MNKGDIIKVRLYCRLRASTVPMTIFLQALSVWKKAEPVKFASHYACFRDQRSL